MLRFHADPPTLAGWQMKDYYTLLGLHPGADEEALKAAFRQCVQRHHPDVGGDEAHFREILQAYEGDIRLERSELGGGCVRLCLPLR